jgi:hypothetical protein
MWNKWLGVAMSTALVGAVAASNGCSSSSAGASPGDGGSDTGVVVSHHDGGSSSGTDSGSGDGGSGEAGVGFDGTSGKACKTDTDCYGGAGINLCSNNSKLGYEVTDLVVTLWPSPICLVAPPTVSGTGNCDPCGESAGGTCGDNAIWGCDSDPTTLDVLTSPGLCLPLTNPPTANQGICIPACQLPLDGSKPTGATAPNTCDFYTVVEPQTGPIVGIGFVQGSCQADADCSGLGSGWICQLDIGFCTQATAQKTRTKTAGTPCTAGTAKTTDSETGACNCFSGNNPNTGSSTASVYAGYCTSACVIGGTACPTGYVCDGLYPSGPLDFGDAAAPALSMQNTGAAGTCLQVCTNADGGTSSDGGAQCPTNSTCLAETLEGPDCLP